MDFVKSHLEKMKLWPVEHFWLTFFPDQHWICADLEKKWAKSVQLVRVSFFRSDFLQNPYFKNWILPMAVWDCNSWLRLYECKITLHWNRKIWIIFVAFSYWLPRRSIVYKIFLSTTPKFNTNLIVQAVFTFKI